MSLQGRVLSNGLALEPGDPDYGLMLDTLQGIFETHQKGGTVTIEHDTCVVYGRFSPHE